LGGKGEGNIFHLHAGKREKLPPPVVKKRKKIIGGLLLPKKKRRKNFSPLLKGALKKNNPRGKKNGEKNYKIGGEKFAPIIFQREKPGV